MKNTIRFAAFILSLTLSSCGGGEHSATDTGSASFGLIFEQTSAPAEMKLAPSAAPVTDICSSYGIDSISGTVYNSSNTVIATGGPWACSAHQGTINNIPSGSNLKIAIQGTISGSVVWQGETTGKTIYSGQDTNVGSIPMTYTGSDTTRPTITVATPTGDTVPLTSPITVAFSESMASSTIDTTTFTLKNGSVAVSGSVSYNSTTKTATFTPTSTLSNSVIYTATVSTDVTDIAANKMQNLYTWDFTTEAPPSSAPTTPTSVTATAADKQVMISWTAVSGATSYNIYWSTTTGVTKTNGTQITGATTPYIHTALTNGTTYYYAVTAVNSYGESAASSQASAMPTSGGTADTTAPSNTTAANFTNSGASSTSSTAVSLAISATDAVAVTAYYVSETSSTPSASALGWTAITSTTSYSASVSFPLSSGDGTKTVYVWFKDAAGNLSIRANDSIILSTGSIPSAPAGVAVTAGNGQATITWNSVSGATSYNIYWSTTSGVTKTSGAMISIASGPYIHTGLINGTTYYYVITAVNSYGESGESSETYATPASTSTYLMGGSMQGNPLNLTNTVTTFAGSAGAVGVTDGIGTAARFSDLRGITTDGTNLFVVDCANSIIRKVVISTGEVTTIAGSVGIYGSIDGIGTAARFNSPIGITTDGTNLFVADYGNSTIRKIVISTGEVTTIAGSAGTNGSIDGIGTASRFYLPAGITTDGANLFIADCHNHTIRKIVISTGVVTTIAGAVGVIGSTDGMGSAARFNYPYGITTDGQTIFVADFTNHTIRKFDISSGIVYTIAGIAGVIGSTDGIGTATMFRYPVDITTDGTNIFVADYGNSTIRKIVISTGAVTTIAGSAGISGSTDGVGAVARFNGAQGLTTDGTKLFVTDFINNTIRKIQ